MAKPKLFDFHSFGNQKQYRQKLREDPNGVFWSKVDKRSPNDCWNWMCSTLPNGYGQAIHAAFATTLAHRIAYELVVGQIPDGMQLDHLCRNHRCVNPAHLEPVSARENVLRGVGVCSINAKKTHCPKGHEYTPENTKLTHIGGRGCKACAAEKRREKYRSRTQKSRDQMNEARRKKRRENPQKYREQDKKRRLMKKGKA